MFSRDDHLAMQEVFQVKEMPLALSNVVRELELLVQSIIYYSADVHELRARRYRYC